MQTQAVIVTTYSEYFFIQLMQEYGAWIFPIILGIFAGFCGFLLISIAFENVLPARQRNNLAEYVGYTAGILTMLWLYARIL